jgi:TP901 family phage tail tape measure protein
MANAKVKQTIDVEVGLGKVDYTGITSKIQTMHNGIEQSLKQAAVSGQMNVPVSVAAKFTYKHNRVNMHEVIGGVPQSQTFSPLITVAPKFKTVNHDGSVKTIRKALGIDGVKLASKEMESEVKSLESTYGKIHNLRKESDKLKPEFFQAHSEMSNGADYKKFNHELQVGALQVQKYKENLNELERQAVTASKTLHDLAARQNNVQNLVYARGERTSAGKAFDAAKNNPNLDMAEITAAQKRLASARQLVKDLDQVNLKLKNSDAVLSTQRLNAIQRTTAAEITSFRSQVPASVIKAQDSYTKVLMDAQALRNDSKTQDAKVLESGIKEAQALNGRISRLMTNANVTDDQKTKLADQLTKKEGLISSYTDRLHEVKHESKIGTDFDKQMRDSAGITEGVQQKLANKRASEEARKRNSLSNLESNLRGTSESAQLRESVKQDKLTSRATSILQETDSLKRLRKEITDMPLEDLKNLGKRYNEIQHKIKLSPANLGDMNDRHLADKVIDLQGEFKSIQTLAQNRLKFLSPTEGRSASRGEQVKAAEVKLGEQFIAEGTRFTSRPREDMRFIKAAYRNRMDETSVALSQEQPGSDKHTELSRNMKEHEAGWNKASHAAKEYRGVLGKVGHAFDTLTRYGAVGAIVYNVANAIKEVVSSVIALEDEMKNIQAITSSSDTQMAVINQSIKDTAVTTAFSIKEIAGAVKTVAQAGVEMKDIPKTVQAIADVATATGSQLQTAADIITTVKEVWDGIDVSTIGDRITQAVNISKLQIEDLKTILSLNAAAAKSANVSLEQSLSLDALLRNSGVKASTIATGSTQMYRELFSPDKKFSDFLSSQYAKKGEDVTAEQASKKFSDYRNSENPLIQAVAELKRIGVGDYKSIAEMERALDSRALNVFKPLLNSKESLAGLEAQMRAGATAAAGAATASHTTKKAFENLGDQVEVLADAIGEPFLKPLTAVINKLKEYAGDAASDLTIENSKDKRNARNFKELPGDANNPNHSRDAARVKNSKEEDYFRKTGVVIGAGMADLLAQQTKGMEKPTKELESLKNYTDSPDSLLTYFKDSQAKKDVLNATIVDTVGGDNSQKLSEQLLQQLSKADPSKDNSDLIEQIKTQFRGTNSVSSESFSKLVLGAKEITEPLTGTVKGLRDLYMSLVTSEEELSKSGKLELEAISELIKNPVFKGAIVDNKALTPAQAEEFIKAVQEKVAPVARQAQEDLKTKAALNIGQQTLEVGNSENPDEKNVFTATRNDNIRSALEANGKEFAGVLKTQITNQVKDYKFSPAVESALLLDANNQIETVLQELNKTVSEKAEALIVAYTDQISNLDLIPIEKREPEQQRAAGVMFTEVKRLSGGMKKHQDIVNEAASTLGVDPFEIAARGQHESNGNEKAQNPEPGSSARGVMQQLNISREQVKQWGYDKQFGFGMDPFNARDSIFGGASIIKGLTEKEGFKDEQQRQLAYHAGPALARELIKTTGGDFNKLPEPFNSALKEYNAMKADLIRQNQTQGKLDLPDAEKTVDLKVSPNVAHSSTILKNTKAAEDARKKQVYTEANSVEIEARRLEMTQMQLDFKNDKKNDDNDAARAEFSAKLYEKQLVDLNGAIDWAENTQDFPKTKVGHKARAAAIAKAQQAKQDADISQAESQSKLTRTDGRTPFNENDPKYVAFRNQSTDAEIKKANYIAEHGGSSGKQAQPILDAFDAEKKAGVDGMAAMKLEHTQKFRTNANEERDGLGTDAKVAELKRQQDKSDAEFALTKKKREIEAARVPFNESDPTYRSHEKAAVDLGVEMDNLAAANKHDPALDSKDKERTAHIVANLNDKLQKSLAYSWNDVEKELGKDTAERDDITAKIAKENTDLAKRIKERSIESVLKNIQTELKVLDKTIELNDTNSKVAEDSGNLTLFNELEAQKTKLVEDRRLKKIEEIKANPDKTNQAQDLIDAADEAKKAKEALHDVGSFNTLEAAKLSKVVDKPIEGASRKGRQDALGHTQYLSDQKAQNTRDMGAQQAKLADYLERISTLQPAAQSTDINISEKAKLDIEQLGKEADIARAEIAKLGVVAEDLAPTLANQLGQISASNIGAEIDNLNGSLKNLDKNLTSRAVQFADAVSGDLADSTIKAAEGLLGFKIATKEATDALLNVMDKKGDLALLQTNRIDLAQKIASVRMNEVDPVAQEAQIKAATDAQVQAEQLAQFQINEAQKAADKVAFNESFAGKLQLAGKDLIEGAVKDVIKAEVTGLFSDALGSAPTKPIYAEVTNFPEKMGGTGASTSPTGLIGTAFNKVKSFFTDTSGGTTPPPSEGLIQDQGTAPRFDSTSASGVTISPLADQTSSIVGEFTDGTSMAGGGGAAVDALGTAAETGIFDGMSKTWDETKTIFTDFTDVMGDKLDGFVTGLGATLFSALGVSKKESTLDQIKKWTGIASSVLGLAAGAGKAFSGLGSIAGDINMETSTFDGPVQYNAATGGYITGPGSGTSDSIPAMLSNGEYVIKADAVRHIGKDVLDNWNAISRAPVHRATGGAVGTLSPSRLGYAAPAPAQQAPAGDTNIRVVMVDDQRRVGDFINSSEGEKVLVNFMKRNSTMMKQVVK